MPIFRVYLEDPNSEHYRRSTINAESEEEAVRELQRRELRAVAYQLDADEATSLEAEETAVGFGSLSGRDRAKLHTHRQSEPYRIAEVQELEG